MRREKPRIDKSQVHGASVGQCFNSDSLKEQSKGLYFEEEKLDVFIQRIQALQEDNSLVECFDENDIELLDVPILSAIFCTDESSEDFIVYTELLVTDEMDLVTILERTNYCVLANIPNRYDLKVDARLIEIAKYSIHERSLYADATM